MNASEFTANHSEYGPGAVNASQDAHSSYDEYAFAITQSLFSGNSSGGSDAGAISVFNWMTSANGEPLQIRESTFTENSSEYGAADLAVRSVMGMDSDAKLLVADSTFAGSISGEPSQARSISVRDITSGSLAIENSTFDGEDSAQPMLGVDMLSDDAGLSITHGTFVGGGIDVGYSDPADGSEVSVRATVFDTGSDPLVTDGEAFPVTEEFNRTRTASALLPDATEDSSADMALEPLADNGGTTQTRRPAAGSVLIDQVETALLDADQRGVSRPQGAASDVGAVERAVATVVLDTDLVVTEGDAAVVPVIRTGELAEALTGDAEVTLAAADGTAVVDTDYTFAESAVEFAAAAESVEPQRAELTIPTVARAGLQGDRTFTVSIAEVAAGHVTGEPATITVTIQDLDEGTTDGSTDGTTDGATDGSTDGTTDGSTDGTTDGATDGSTDGTTDGSTDGATDGSTDGATDGGTGGGAKESGNLAATGGAEWVWSAVLAAAAALLGGAILLGRRATRSAERMTP